MKLKDLTSAAYLCNKFSVSWKRKNNIAIFGAVLLALFSFQFLTSFAMASGLLPDPCAAMHATNQGGDSVVTHSEDNRTNGSSQEQSNHCSCSCHHATFVGFFVSQSDFFINAFVQDKVAAAAADFPSDGLARLIYLPPRLS